MAYRQLFLFVEGDDDERFLRAVIEPLFRSKYDDVRFVKFSMAKQDKVAAFLRSVEAIPDADYLLVGDLDMLPCVTAAKERIQRKFPPVDPARVQIVKTEIESWYCAGVTARDPEVPELAKHTETEGITKESFNHAVSKRGLLRVPVMTGILERFDLESAARRNRSFHYFLRKYLPFAA
jgi:hypothetical protein